MKFRGDIEGLRGFAVLLVMLAHAGIPGFSGGFVGVDIFFVISGFLITGLLVDELRDTGRIDFLNFYARRAKRLLAALFAMLMLVSIACMMMLPRQSQPFQATAAFWASLWASNIHFATSSFGYFEAAAKTNAFLHTWSLGVEEQFYLIWPALLLVSWKAGLGKRLSFVVGFLCLASLIACMLIARTRADLDYYLMPTRLWQLACGAIAFFFPIRSRLLPALGAMGLFAALAGISDATPYPSAWTLLPVAGAALVLAADPARLSNRWLTAAPLRWLGKISYGAYLWHWPVLVLGASIWPSESLSIRICLLLIALTLATASEKWLERPIRRSDMPAGKTVKIAVLTTLMVATGMWIWRAHANSVLVNANRIENGNSVEKFVAENFSLPQVYSARHFDDYYESDRLVPVVSQRPSGPAARRVLLAGDSIGMQWEPAFNKLAKIRGWELMAVTKSACPMVDVPFVNGRIKRRYVECERWRTELVSYINTYQPDLLILGSATDYEFSSDEWEQGGRRVLDAVSGNVKQIVILAPIPKLPFQPRDCVLRNARMTSSGLEMVGTGCSVSLKEAEQREFIAHWRAVANMVPRTQMLDLDEIVCPSGICSAIRGGQMTYRDQSHLNAKFVSGLAVKVGDKLDGLESGHH